jgi:hypothetical protein
MSDISDHIWPMIKLPDDVFFEIVAFLEERGMAETTFGRLAVNDPNIVKRVRSGGVSLTMGQRLLDFMAAYRQQLVAGN